MIGNEKRLANQRLSSECSFCFPKLRSILRRSTPERMKTVPVISRMRESGSDVRAAITIIAIMGASNVPNPPRTECIHNSGFSEE
jgi:hypothetical protein